RNEDGVSIMCICSSKSNQREQRCTRRPKAPSTTIEIAGGLLYSSKEARCHQQNKGFGPLKALIQPSLRPFCDLQWSASCAQETCNGSVPKTACRFHARTHADGLWPGEED